MCKELKQDDKKCKEDGDPGKHYHKAYFHSNSFHGSLPLFKKKPSVPQPWEDVRLFL